MVDVLAEILVYVRLIEVGNSTSLLTRNKVIFLWTMKAKTSFLRWLDPVFLGGYHPTLKLSGIPTFTFIVSPTYSMDNI